MPTPDKPLCAGCGRPGRTLQDFQGQQLCTPCIHRAKALELNRPNGLLVCVACGCGLWQDDAFWADPETGELQAPPKEPSGPHHEECWLEIAPEQPNERV